jgi:hypothetical protein
MHEFSKLVLCEEKVLVRRVKKFGLLMPVQRIDLLLQSEHGISRLSDCGRTDLLLTLRPLRTSMISVRIVCAWPQCHKTELTCSPRAWGLGL